uniref:ATP synthase complex subunit 8 n=1 Tax=Erianthus versicolor TaxID=470935 RepID=K9LKK7_9ORTH|nr:ATP synthase F0 subunit 8 [Erianthus versicolor]
MPQMAPINWMSMYWSFIFILLLVGILNFYLSLGNMMSLDNSLETSLNKFKINE